MAKGEIVRFAVASDLEFLAKHVYVPEDVVRRKIDLGEFVIATRDREPLGFIQLEYLWSKLPYIALIRVIEEHRRRGIGKAMLGFLEGFLKERQFRSLYSSSQADEHEPQEWHRHVGFSECGVIHEINDGIDEIFFRKTID